MKKYSIVVLVLAILNLASVQGANNFTNNKPAFLPPPGFSISFTVDDGTNAISGAYVTCNDTIIQTDTNGVALFILPDGVTSYSYLINAAGYVDYSGDVIANGVMSLNIHMSTFHTLQFSISDGSNPLQGAIIQINGDTAITGAGGIALFSNKFPGFSTYFYTVSADGYADYSSQFYLRNIDTLIGPISLDKAYDITFTVKNAMDSILTNAFININGEIIQTDSTGVAIFTKKINGTYDYQIIADGYVDKTGQVLISNANSQVNAILSTGFNLTLTIFNGPIGNVPLAWDTVTIGAINKITNDTSGIAVFGLSPGSYPVTLHKTGFADTTIIVDIVDKDVSISVHLSPIYTVIFNVADGLSFSMLDSVNIHFNGTTQFTNTDGNSVFVNVNPSALPRKYFTSAKGNYLPDTGYVSVPYNSVTTDTWNIIVQSVYLVRPGIGISLIDNGSSYTKSAIIRVDSVSYPYDSVAGISYLAINPGLHTYTLTPADLNKAILSDTFSVSTSGSDYLNISLADAYKISIYVMDTGKHALQGATVILDSYSQLTNSDGIAVFSRLMHGTHYYSVLFSDFDTISGIEIYLDTLSLSDTVWMIHSKFNVTIVVTDNSAPVPDAAVTLIGPLNKKGTNSMNEVIGKPTAKFGLPSITKYTDITGTVVFDGMSAGSYSYTIVKAGYPDSTGYIDVKNMDVIKIIAYDTATGIANVNYNVMNPYPNPTSSKVNVSIPGDLSQSFVSVIGINGRVIRSSVHSRQQGTIIAIDLQNLPAGQYFIKVSGNEYQKVWVVTKM